VRHKEHNCFTDSWMGKAYYYSLQQSSFGHYALLYIKFASFRNGVLL